MLINYTIQALLVTSRYLQLTINVEEYDQDGTSPGVGTSPGNI